MVFSQKRYDGLRGELILELEDFQRYKIVYSGLLNRKITNVSY